VDDESQSQSDEFVDALDIPYKRLEEYADILSLNVLQRSINVFRREKERFQQQFCQHKMKHGSSFEFF
jgi:hypothetical protein